MPEQDKRGLPWPAPLAGRLPDGASAELIADTIVAVWTEIDHALNPIIGFRGVAALYNRSLKLSATFFPWLGAGHQGELTAIDVTALRATLAQQAPVEAAAGGIALFQSFHELLAGLVGAALTDQLLHSVWAPPSGTAPAQDTSP